MTTILTRQEINDIISSNPKTFTTILKHRHKETYDAISNYATFGRTFAEKIYCYVNSIPTNTCTDGNVKNFKSYNDGFAFCGKPAVCKCCKASVSAACKATASVRTKEEQEAINAKRAATWLELSGGKYSNAGQTPKAVESRNALFADPEYKKYYVDKFAATCMERYGVKNPQQRNPAIMQLQSKDEALKLYNLYTNDISKMSAELNVHEKTIRGYLLSHEIITKSRSVPEQEVLDYLLSIGIDKSEIIVGDRTLLGNKQEVDFYLPKYNLAIEYNGVHWHSEAFYNPRITDMYHYNKCKLAKDKGVQLIQIYCFQWTSQRDIIKARIKAKLGISDRIFARKCIIKEISFPEYALFLKRTHMQGTAMSSARLGLFYNNELVAVAGFSKTRAIVGRRKSDTDSTYELVRYASTGNVVGGASKLLKYFIKTYSPTLIRTYSDNMWNSGNMYSAIGFTYVKETKPGYWYVKKNTDKMLHRSNFTKKKLIEQGHPAELTEKDIMSNLNYYKIWDCGHKIWEYQIK